MARTSDPLAAHLGRTGTRLAYGEPVSIGGVDTVPVAIVGYGFGSGEDTQGHRGGGGGSWAVPLGVYVPGARGRPTFQPNPITLLAVGIPFLWVAGHAIREIVSALKN
ncbi:hypothetical protein [Sandaracinus amylolyticus]|uniref:Uncharacterized protein n=1 Tax=Sandaracinus amylolyticus TaxID=927083 RepID=A0A0F6SET5_9BACT|nr:hypothetical protein [Sandaracinus amylolyticus]AKF05754.1 Hypothetical protein DB32_002903 [Sandaracinus amylolyticus]